MKENERAVLQLEYVFKFGTLVNLINDSFQYLRLEREVTDLQIFAGMVEAIKRMFAELNPDIFKHPSSSDLYQHIEISHALFKEMLDSGTKITDCIEAFFRTGNAEELRPLVSGGLIKTHAELLRKLNKSLDSLNIAYAKLNKQIIKSIRTVIKK